MHETPNLKAIREIKLMHEPQLYLAQTLWVLKKRFDSLLAKSSRKILTKDDLLFLIKIFGSYWINIDHLALNLGHEPTSESYASDEKLRAEHRARLFETMSWLKNMGFTISDWSYPETLARGTNAIMMSLDETSIVLHEGIDRAGTSRTSEHVELYSEGIEHIALDVKSIMPDEIDKRELNRLGLTMKDISLNNFKMPMLVAIFKKNGFAFTSGIQGSELPNGRKFWQCFTDEIDRGFFLELIERKGSRDKLVPEQKNVGSIKN